MSIKKILYFLLFFILLITIPLTTLYISSKKTVPSSQGTSKTNNFSNTKNSFKKFTSVEDFKAYLSETSEPVSYGMGSLSTTSLGAPSVGSVGMAPQGISLPSNKSETSSLNQVSNRTSQTNVQVLGIDEPDIVKNDGQNIYFSSNLLYYPRPLPVMQPMMGLGVSGSIMPGSPYYNQPKTKIIKAFPPEALTQISTIDQNGNLLVSKNILMVITSNAIMGYDVSNTASPSQKWKMDFSDNNYLLQARLYNDKLFLVTRQTLDIASPCPIKPLGVNSSVVIRCADIYHPVVSVPVDSTYTAMVIDPSNGDLSNKVSFVGSNGLSVVYMSANSLYVTYSYSGDYVAFLYQFFNEKGKDLLPQIYLDKIKKLEGYDISNQAKMVELSNILNTYQNSLTSDEKLKVENEMTNRMKDFMAQHIRDLQKTGIAKINIADFSIAATGEIPGYPLNQFSLDEYSGNLRIATTVSGSSFGGSSDSTNDVYVLNQNLAVIGYIKDLGQKERIYSVRFIENKGYLVTFRQTDPFYVLDLSNPSSPKQVGELKIPGYSSYLHPILPNQIVGFGKEGSQLKISLFDVSNPSNPTELAKYNLDEYTSDVLETHHAFLQDKKHNVFFIPGNKGAYIFSYEGNTLKLVKAVANIQARRAVYINDYMYIVGDDKIVVLNESDWSTVKELPLQ